jgi:hypothetical protein
MELFLDWKNCREISLRESDRELPVKDNGPLMNAG